MVATKLVVLYFGGFITIIFAAIAIRFYKMPRYEYNRLRRHTLRKSLCVDTKRNCWKLF